MDRETTGDPGTATTSPEANAEPAESSLQIDTPLDLRILQAFRRIMRAVDLNSRKLMAEHQITGPQLICLNSIAQRGPLTASEIARVVHLSASTVSGILDRLEQKGLILREQDLRDRRALRVTATSSGRALVDRAPSPLNETLVRGLARLSPLEQTAIALALERVVDLIEVRHIDAAPLLESSPIDRSLEPPGEKPDDGAA